MSWGSSLVGHVATVVIVEVQPSVGVGKAGLIAGVGIRPFVFEGEV